MLRFWQDQHNGGKLQKLAKIATQLLAIPATSTASERVFSVYGNIHTERRCRLQPETLEKLLFLKYNTRLIHEVDSDYRVVQNERIHYSSKVKVKVNVYLYSASS